jgi:hypothetical protein
MRREKTLVGGIVVVAMFLRVSEMTSFFSIEGQCPDIPELMV